MKTMFLSLLLAVVTIFTSSSCTTDNNDNVSAPPNTYVLVHGAWQAPYVWSTVKTNIEKQGQKVIVVELPGHGSDNTPTHTLSLDVYRDKVIDAINMTDGKVILVGHSMAGMVISNVAEKVPSKINKLVFIGAFLPESGQSLGDLAQLDAGSQLGASLVQSADQLTFDIKSENLVHLFINDGSQAAKDLVVNNYRPEPAIPLGNKITLTAQNFGSVQKIYIKTLQDIVISPGFQDQMISKAGISKVYEVNTSHSPFLSKPNAISDLLIKVGL
jgi:pimeloyl-ACP methyl ester carboxylesterase